ncbi:MAG: undecaprenyl/decaprenyl-phosphate alpha-N-acetylglucosaminyl 1-phosphate transferase [Caldilineaceae bacterium]|nr:undecaprenyl/decaprenyl-phosphate alpha-N-acetylglucosaminyl 1-phosphate transferase [Caldilineaceae bacterium]
MTETKVILSSPYPSMFTLTVLLVSFLLAFALTPLSARLGHRLGLVDRPGGRRSHRGIIARTGGLALFGAFGLTVVLTLILPSLLPPEIAAQWLPPRNDPNEGRRLTALLVGSVFCAGAGLLDDRFRFSALPQYAIQIAAGLIAIAGLIFIKHVNNPFAPGLFFGDGGFPWWIVVPLTIFWFIGMMNTVNFLDGLSGLATGVAAIVCAILALHMLFQADPPQASVAVLPVALLGATLGFLPANFRGRIFMGSSGSFFLGFALACLGIIGGARLATVLLVIGLPALDVAWLIYSRRRRGLSPGQAGRDHLHFRLLDIGLGERTIVLAYWLFCAVFGALTLVLDGRLYKLFALAGLGLVGLAVLIWAAMPHKDVGSKRVK